MYPGMIFWWQNRVRDGSRAAWAQCGGGSPGWGSSGGGGGECGDSGGESGGGSCGGFGVRRPLRFLAYKLRLDETQVAELARIINDLKTERAQADVDERRVMATLADAVSGSSFDEAQAAQAASQRTKSTERLQQTVVRALGKIHALLNAEQRATLAYLIRTGTLSL